MSNNIDNLKVKLKYCKKERLKELFKNGDFIVPTATPIALGIISGLPFIINNSSKENTFVAMSFGFYLGLSVGSMHFFTKYHDSIYTKKIRLIKKEIKEEKKLIKQKKLK